MDQTNTKNTEHTRKHTFSFVRKKEKHEGGNKKHNKQNTYTFFKQEINKQKYEKHWKQQHEEQSKTIKNIKTQKEETKT